MKQSDFLEQVYEDLKTLGLVANQYDFSVMCGRTPAWFSTLKARGLPLTSDAALTLSHNIRQRAAGMVDRRDTECAFQLSEAVIQHAQLRIAHRQDRRQTEYAQ